MINSEKLQKVLARAGLGSRREMEAAIEAGRVVVNGRPAKLGDRVTEEDKILFGGKPVKAQDSKRQRLRVILYNKPEGEICSRSDPEGRPTVYDRLPYLKQGRWISVGRLDFNTSGLLLFTNDGEFANKLMHPASVIDREYLVRVFGAVDDEMKQRLLDGVLLEDGMARFTALQEKTSDSSNHWFYCVVMEGRNREVRRLWESQEVKVSRLKRVRFGNIFLPSQVRMGQWIELNNKEIQELAETAGYSPPDNVRPLTPQEQEDFDRHRRRLKGKARRGPPRKKAAPRRPRT